MNIISLITENFDDIMKGSRQYLEDNLLYHNEPIVRKNLALHTDDPNHHNILMHDPDPHVRSSLAKNPYLSSEHTYKLINDDPHPNVRIAARDSFGQRLASYPKPEHISLAMKLIDNTEPKNILGIERHIARSIPAHLMPVSLFKKLEQYDLQTDIYPKINNVKDTLGRCAATLKQTPHPELNEYIKNCDYGAVHDHMLFKHDQGIINIPPEQVKLHEQKSREGHEKALKDIEW